MSTLLSRTVLEDFSVHCYCVQMSLLYIFKTIQQLQFQVAGYRTVPIELGHRYTDDSWTQSLMTIGHFVDNYLQRHDKGTGYLAQHELFDQVSVISRPLLKR